MKNSMVLIILTILCGIGAMYDWQVTDAEMTILAILQVGVAICDAIEQSQERP
ncbi:hypothetical protein P106B_82 [Rhizobium phage vB_RglS_P106B]|uniref:Uncharacterized protein n=1 Tax=Rhizobium phage vB_RglS_P106B TaxID=1458697 RepID=W6E8J5_9CAUD|nr:hypothetical protein P106B_82 [Rhizobium phage vB_RglS_P106B]AHJ10765.1 hypothetical protein P106B_82 [Rhizobium phage vB_RglS_P106B]